VYESHEETHQNSVTAVFRCHYQHTPSKWKSVTAGATDLYPWQHNLKPNITVLKIAMWDFLYFITIPNTQSWWSIWTWK